MVYLRFVEQIVAAPFYFDVPGGVAQGAVGEIGQSVVSDWS